MKKQSVKHNNVIIIYNADKTNFKPFKQMLSLRKELFAFLKESVI